MEASVYVTETRERCVYLITVIYLTELGINDTIETRRNV